MTNVSQVKAQILEILAEAQASFSQKTLGELHWQFAKLILDSGVLGGLPSQDYFRELDSLFWEAVHKGDRQAQAVAEDSKTDWLEVVNHFRFREAEMLMGGNSYGSSSFATEAERLFESRIQAAGIDFNSQNFPNSFSEVLSPKKVRDEGGDIWVLERGPGGDQKWNPIMGAQFWEPRNEWEYAPIQELSFEIEEDWG